MFNLLSTFCFSMHVTKKLIIGSIKSFIHAIYPDIFITTTSDLLIELKNEMNEIGCRKMKINYSFHCE